ncbi:helix-turn-helix domain-containing protein [Nonomuraea sp. K274]|uniref:Helix-turn-helix domain-containing protein n=1 Tax=Nonomuraea cypriaca TaxID=1187855 RepID=A0A931EUN7_9ACTN|nr:helix-turn-helix domain-containing protein [Nonomuraea cypriaca]
MISGVIGPPDEWLRTACVSIPKALVNVPAEHLDGLLGRPIPAADGIGGLLIDFVTDLCDHGPSFRPADGPRVGMALLDLISALLNNALETGLADVRDKSGRNALIRRIMAFIQQHLREPDLTPSAVASAHYISVSHLHRLFQTQGLTVTAWIRRQRLERARSDLADPSLRDVPIHAIATAWGFAHPADFSRAFRRAFGSSAINFRRKVCRQLAS